MIPKISIQIKLLHGLVNERKVVNNVSYLYLGGFWMEKLNLRLINRKID